MSEGYKRLDWFLYILERLSLKDPWTIVVGKYMDEWLISYDPDMQEIKL